VRYHFGRFTYQHVSPFSGNSSVVQKFQEVSDRNEALRSSSSSPVVYFGVISTCTVVRCVYAPQSGVQPNLPDLSSGLRV
jgi:hypothetical protein